MYPGLLTPQLKTVHNANNVLDETDTISTSLSTKPF